MKTNNMKINNMKVRELISDIKMFKNILENLNKGFDMKLSAICFILSRNPSLSICSQKITRFKFIFNHYLNIPYCYSEKLNTSLKYHTYYKHVDEKSLFLWPNNIYGYNMRILFCEGIIEEMKVEILELYNNCSWYIKIIIKLQKLLP